MRNIEREGEGGRGAAWCGGKNCNGALSDDDGEVVQHNSHANNLLRYWGV